jgi:hypothetical protein
MKVFRRFSRVAAVCLLAGLMLVAAQADASSQVPITKRQQMAAIGVLPLRRSQPMRHQEKPTPTPTPTPIITPDYKLALADEGTLPVLDRVPTKQKVVFMTIDDGATRLPIVQTLLTRYKIRASLFLNSVYTVPEPAYFQQLDAAGSVVENHTTDHADLTKLNYNQQLAEICGDADSLAAQFGRRPTLFRPPYGSYNQTTLRAASACGQKAIILWHAKANGGSMQYQDGNTGLLPGDIVLVHFRPEFLQDFTAFRQAALTAGLQPELLEDWLGS